VDAWDKAKRSATRLKPDYRKKGGAQKPCSRCQDARVVLDESPDFRPAV
jgi:hypothetical protein